MGAALGLLLGFLFSRNLERANRNDSIGAQRLIGGKCFDKALEIMRFDRAVGIEIASLTSKSFNGNGVAPPPTSNWSHVEPTSSRRLCTAESCTNRER